MFCSNCGIENTEGSAFCKNCGKPLSAPATPVYSAPVFAPPVQAARPPLSSHPVINVIKKVASSPLFLVAIIAYSVQILGTIIGAATSGALVREIIYNLLYEIGGDIPYELYEILDRMAMVGKGPVIVGTIIGLIPTILICVGLWITYGSALSRASDTMKTSGLTMIKVITIIQLIGVCLGLAGVELLLMVLVILAADAGAPGVVVALLVMFVILAAAVYVLQIIYLSKIVKSLNIAKGTIATGVASDKVSSFVAIWAFISAGCLVFNLITSFISSAAAMTSLICFGILIFKYKSAMRGLMYPQQIQ